MLDTTGTRLGFREFLHPHVTEQLFTRALSGVTIPPEATPIQIRARCLMDGKTAKMYQVVVNR